MLNSMKCGTLHGLYVYILPYCFGLYIHSTHFLRSTPGAPLLVSPLGQSVCLIRSSLLLFPSVCLLGGLREPSTLTGCTLGVLESWVCEISTPPGLVPYCSLSCTVPYWSCSTVRYPSTLCVSGAACIILVCMHCACMSIEGVWMR